MARIEEKDGVRIVSNPAGGTEKFINWLSPSESNADKGVTAPGFYTWQKNEDGSGTNVPVEFPFVFQYLQDAAGISGYIKKRNKFIHSNEVLDVYETSFDIKVWEDGKEEILKSGFYYTDQKVPKSKMTPEEFKELKAGIKKDGENGSLQMLPQTVSGSKKCKILYILVNGEVMRMKLEGGKLSAWNRFQKEQNDTKWKGKDNNLSNFIVWSDNVTLENEKGDDYTVPVFKYQKASQEEIDEANQVYEDQVKPYFDFILSTSEV